MRIVFLLLALSSLLFGERVEKGVVWRCPHNDRLTEVLNKEEKIRFYNDRANYMFECVVVAIDDPYNMKAICDAEYPQYVNDVELRNLGVTTNFKEIYNTNIREFEIKMEKDLLEEIKSQCQMGKVSFE